MIPEDCQCIQQTCLYICGFMMQFKCERYLLSPISNALISANVPLRRSKSSIYFRTFSTRSCSFQVSKFMISAWKKRTLLLHLYYCNKNATVEILKLITCVKENIFRSTKSTWSPLIWRKLFRSWYGSKSTSSSEQVHLPPM